MNPFEDDDPFSYIFSTIKETLPSTPRPLRGKQGKNLIDYDGNDYDDSTLDDRSRVVEELWETEKRYVMDLEVIVNVSRIGDTSCVATV